MRKNIMLRIRRYLFDALTQWISFWGLEKISRKMLRTKLATRREDKEPMEIKLVTFFIRHSAWWLPEAALRGKIFCFDFEFFILGRRIKRKSEHFKWIRREDHCDKTTIKLFFSEHCFKIFSRKKNKRKGMMWHEDFEGAEVVNLIAV